MSPMSLSPAHN